MRKVLLVCSLAMCASGAAFAQGEGEGEGEEPCGAVTAEGECDGTDAIWCDTASGNLQRVPCGDIIGDGSVVGACEVYSGFGSWCAMSDGDACAFQSGDQNVYFACATDSSGCVNGVCTAGVGACTPDGPDQATVECLDGANIQLGCASWAQSIAIGCAEIDPASTCANNACGNIGAGGTCDGEVAVCADGLTCGTDNTCGGGAEGEGEEGEGEGDAGECESDRDCDDGEVCTDGECVGGSEDPPVCSHTGTTSGLPAAGLLALGGMVLGLRRRRA